MFSFISFRRNINYLLPGLLNFWKPDTLPRITNCYDVHAYNNIMPQHQYLAFFVYIITVYTPLYYIFKHKISKHNNIYVYDGKHRPEHFLFIHKTKFHNKKFYSQPASFVPNVVPCLGSSSRFKTRRLCINSSIKPISQFYSLSERN